MIDQFCRKETGEPVGTVINVFNTGASDLLHVELDSSFHPPGKPKREAGASGPLVWVPFVEEIVPNVDLSKKEMLITPPKGLLELNIRTDERSKKERRQLEWKERKKFQRCLIQAKKKLHEMEQHHVFHGFRYGEKSQRSILANEIVAVNSKLLDRVLKNIEIPSRRWSFPDFIRTTKVKHILKVSEEFYYNGKGEHSERGQHLVSCGKVAVVLSLEGTRELEDLNSDMEETYQLLKALLDDDNRLLKAEDRSSVPLVLICPAHSVDSLKELFMNHDFFSFDSEKVWFLAEDMLPVVSSSQEEENKRPIRLSFSRFFEFIEFLLLPGPALSLSLLLLLRYFSRNKLISASLLRLLLRLTFRPIPHFRFPSPDEVVDTPGYRSREIYSMASTEGLVPITRAFLASYYDKYQFPPLSDDVSRLCDEIRTMARDLQQGRPLSEGESLLVHEAESMPPHKIDENMWKNREQIEEILFLLKRSNWPTMLQQQSTAQDAELGAVLLRLKEKFESALKLLVTFQARNSEHVFNTVMTYLPQDFRGTLIRQQKERSERNKQAAVETLINSGGSIREQYALLWNQQMERRKQLAQLGSATGVYKTLVKYLVGVPQVLLDFVRQINDDEGPMEEQRHRYGPPLYSLTKMALNIRLFLSLLWRHLETGKIQGDQIPILEKAVDVYISELERFIKFIGNVFLNAPFFITAEDAGALEASKNEEYQEVSVAAGKTHEVSLTVEDINSYIAWDFSLIQGRLNLQDIGFSLEYEDSSGKKMPILPYKRYESDQGNFCACMAGNYKLVWDNSYSSFFSKVLRYKVDCIPPVSESSAGQVQG